QVPLPRVTATARGQDVRPGVGPPPRQGHQMVAGQALPVPQLLLAARAELAAVVVAGEEECVGHLAAEATGDVDEFHEADDGRPGDLQALAAHDGPGGLDELRLPI